MSIKEVSATPQEILPLLKSHFPDPAAGAVLSYVASPSQLEGLEEEFARDVWANWLPWLQAQPPESPLREGVDILANQGLPPYKLAQKAHEYALQRIQFWRPPTLFLPKGDWSYEEYTQAGVWIQTQRDETLLAFFKSIEPTVETAPITAKMAETSTLPLPEQAPALRAWIFSEPNPLASIERLQLGSDKMSREVSRLTNLRAEVFESMYHNAVNSLQVEAIEAMQEMAQFQSLPLSSFYKAFGEVCLRTWDEKALPTLRLMMQTPKFLSIPPGTHKPRQGLLELSLCQLMYDFYWHIPLLMKAPSFPQIAPSHLGKVLIHAAERRQGHLVEALLQTPQFSHMSPEDLGKALPLIIDSRLLPPLLNVAPLQKISDALYSASKSGDLDRVETILSHPRYVDIPATGSYSARSFASALKIAAEEQKLDIVQKLLTSSKVEEIPLHDPTGHNDIITIDAIFHSIRISENSSSDTFRMIEAIARRLAEIKERSES